MYLHMYIYVYIHIYIGCDAGSLTVGTVIGSRKPQLNHEKSIIFEQDNKRSSFLYFPEQLDIQLLNDYAITQKGGNQTSQLFIVNS